MLRARRGVGQWGKAGVCWAAAVLFFAVTAAGAGETGTSEAQQQEQETPRESSPHADGRPRAATRGISVGLRLAWGLPEGLLAKGDDLNANVSSMVPVWLDAGYRLSREFYVGAFASWGFASVAGSMCPASLSCSANDLRFGANAHLYLGNLIGLDGVAPIDPWVGLGAGYEITNIKLESQGTSATETDRGFELANMQLGVDYTGLGAMRVGGFFTLTLAQYSSRTLEVATGSADYTPDRAFHLWLMFGIRGQYDF